MQLGESVTVPGPDQLRAQGGGAVRAVLVSWWCSVLDAPFWRHFDYELVWAAVPDAPPPQRDAPAPSPAGRTDGRVDVGAD